MEGEAGVRYRERLATIVQGVRSVRAAEVGAVGAVDVEDGRLLTGWIAGLRDPGADGDPDEVEVFLNDILVVALPLVPDRTDPARQDFRFKVRLLLRYARRTDALTVRYRGEALPFSASDSDGPDTAYHPTADGTLPIERLRERLAAGEIFNSDGVLQTPKTADVGWQRGVLGLYERVRAAVSEIAGYDAFLVYGSLLGAVRTGGFIAHDTDLDAAYVSRRTEAHEVGPELTDIALGLIERGLRVECRTVTLHIYDPASGGEHIDLFQTYFDGDGVLRFPWGVAGTSDYRREHWSGTHEADFAGSRVAIPSEAEVMVTALYGDGWRIPDPGFSWARDRTGEDEAGRVPEKLNSWANWVDHHARAPLGDASPFVRSCLSRPDLPRTVIDLGCGDGRDSLALAEAGLTVLGLDFAPTALRRAAARTGAADVRSSEVDLAGVDLTEVDRVEIDFDEADLDDGAELARRITALRAGSSPILFYGRLLLECLFADTAVTLLDTIGRCAVDGDMVAFATRTVHSAPTPLRFRRPVDAAVLERDLAERGFDVLDSVTTLVPGGEPVHRVVARRGLTEAGRPRHR